MKNTTKVRIRIKLQELLDARGITQKQLAWETYIQPYVIRQLCSDINYKVNLGDLEIIAKHLGVTDINELIEFKVIDVNKRGT